MPRITTASTGTRRIRSALSTCIHGVVQIKSRASVADARVRTAVAGLSLVPPGPGLAGASVELPREPGFESRLGHALEPVRERYSYIVLDCPPALGPLTVNALVAADKVIVPVQAEYLALEGLASLLETLGSIDWLG